MIQRIKLTEPKIDSAMKISIWEEINKKHTHYKKTDFDYISRVSTGNVYKVKIGHKYNFIHSDYTLVFNTDDQTEWFDSVENFTSEGLCLVKRDDKYNFLSLDGKLLSTIWFTSASNFNGDYAIVYGSLDINLGGPTINGGGGTTEGGDDITLASAIELPPLQVQGYFLLHNSGTLVKTRIGSTVPAKFVTLTAKEFIQIKNNICIYLDDTFNYQVVRLNGSNYTKLSSDTYSYIDNFADDMFLVKIDNLYNILKTDGTYLLTEWYDYIDKPSNNIIRLGKYSTEESNVGLKYTYVHKNGTLHNEYYDYALPYSEGSAIVYNDNLWNLLDTDFNLISQDWITIEGLNVESVVVNVDGACFSVDDSSKLYKLLQ